MRVAMNPRIEVRDARVFRRNRERDVLCRLTYAVTPFHDDLVAWFLLTIEELE
jgi:hypothetical protein